MAKDTNKSLNKKIDQVFRDAASGKWTNPWA
jgi:hypothetical protein